MLAIGWRDVVIAGEYELQGGLTVQAHPAARALIVNGSKPAFDRSMS
jgi:hypothetical protein